MKVMNKYSGVLIGCLIAIALVIAGNFAGARDSTTETAKLSLPTIAAADLPAEGQAMLQLIKKGGPFPFRKDGSIFGNRERILPNKARGYYKEYTVKTPGAGSRGARRIVAGDVGEFYYTGDHYNSFQRIVE
jgi:ribonuclease T1